MTQTAACDPNLFNDGLLMGGAIGAVGTFAIAALVGFLLHLSRPGSIADGERILDERTAP